MLDEEEPLPDCFTRDPILYPRSVFSSKIPDRSRTTQREIETTFDASLGFDEDEDLDKLVGGGDALLGDLQLEGSGGIASQTVPQSQGYRLPHRRGDDPALEALRQIARSRRSQLGNMGRAPAVRANFMTPTERFAVAGAFMFFGTLATAWAVSVLFL
jgi:hypothetical protein